jgi:starch phosphorylase
VQRLGVDERLAALRTERLTIGFARRFATYKRALLMFQDMPRAKALLCDPERPIQLVFAGKAHPADQPGQRLLRSLVELSRDPELRDHVVVIEDHDLNVSRHLLEGCDLWLNAPRRPLEACGTSGMKAVFNCTLNCSTLDGWWDEAYDGRNGFAFGDGLVHVDASIQDARDARGLLQVLEQEVAPEFYQRNGEQVPVRWVARIKQALKTLAWRYNSDRMVMDYARHTYVSASKSATSHVID